MCMMFWRWILDTSRQLAKIFISNFLINACETLRSEPPPSQRPWLQDRCQDKKNVFTHTYMDVRNAIACVLLYKQQNNSFIFTCIMMRGCIKEAATVYNIHVLQVKPLKPGYIHVPQGTMRLPWQLWLLTKLIFTRKHFSASIQRELHIVTLHNNTHIKYTYHNRASVDINGTPTEV